MTVDLGAIERRATATLSEYRSHTELALRELVREVVPELIAEVKRLRVDQVQGGKDYCDLMERYDALHVRVCKAEDELKLIRELPAKWRNRETFLGENESEQGFVMSCFACAHDLEAALKGEDR